MSETKNVTREGTSRDSAEASTESERGTPVQVRVAPGISLGSAHLALLSQAFAKEKEILVKQEFRSGYSGAVVVLVSVGAGRAPLVVKLAHPHDLQREYAAYEEHVRMVSPQNIAHLQGKPLVAADGLLGLLQYTFAGGESHLPTNSLYDYYETHGAEATSAVLNRIFRVYGRHWWANNRAQSYVLDEHYDRLLPVHFQAEPVDAAIADPPVAADYTLLAGVSGAMASEGIDIGHIVHLKGFSVTKVREDGRTMTLVAAPPANEASAPRRIRVESPTPMPHRPGDVLESLLVRITATRLTLLSAAAEAALPGFTAEADTFTVPVGAGRTLELPNPLCSLPEQLYAVVETKVSIIHGDLNLQNVLVDAPTGFSWLIDFAETRIGPTLLDLQRLEVQVITKLMPAGEEVSPAGVVEVMTRLHADPPMPPPENAALQGPFAVLATLRRLARQYLIDDMDWNEYYRGLVIALVGALKYEELDQKARLLALVSAGAVDRLMDTPLGSENAIPTGFAGGPLAAEATTSAAAAGMEPKQARPGEAEGSGRRRAAERGNRRWAGIGLAAAAVALIGFALWQFGLRPAGTGDTPPVEATPIAAAAAAGGAVAEPVVTAAPVPSATGDAVASEPGPTQADATAVATDSGVTDSGEDDAPAQEATPSAQGAADEATPGPAAQEAAAEFAGLEAGATRVNETDGATYVFVPGGTFTMGSNSGESDEGPTHMVELAPFWIMRTETTSAQYGLCVAAGACTAPKRDGWDDPELAEHPVTHVTWQQANDYAAWAAGALGARLPTEAEWEKAARGTDQRAYPWGSDAPSNYLLNFNFALGATAPVGSYPDGASPYGALDMAGNVEEWVADRYDPAYYAASPERNPLGADEGMFRVVRGGSYYSNGMDVRTFAREKALDTASFDSVGFRVLLPAE